jgi:uncharacterized LabA/DUF88 family protein
MTSGPLRTWVLIDAQNVYKDAREAHHAKGDSSICGQTYPRKIAELLAGRGAKDQPRVREITKVKLFTGYPSPSREGYANAAHMRQRAAWERDGVEFAGRVLRYPYGWPDKKPYEKGIDVALAVDLVFGGARRFYDVAIVFSTDTDLLPALEAVLELKRAWGEPKLEVATWADHPRKKRLRVDGEFVYCHNLTAEDYELVRDPTVYSKAAPQISN